MILYLTHIFVFIFVYLENVFWSACCAQLLTPLTFLPYLCISKNPFVFWPHFVSNYNLLLNSTSLPAERISLSPNWYDNTRAYSHFLENNALGGSNSTNGISPYSFRYRDFCICFDLNPGVYWNMKIQKRKQTKK